MRSFRSQISVTNLLSSYYQRAINRTFPAVQTAIPTSSGVAPNGAVRVVVTQCPKTVYGDYQCATAMTVAKKIEQQPAQVAKVSLLKLPKIFFSKTCNKSKLLKILTRMIL